MREIKDRAEFGELLNEMGLTELAVEIGVYRGEFASQLLDTWKGRYLYLVDPWESLSDYDDPMNSGDRNADLGSCLLRLEPHTGRFFVRRTRSELEAVHWPENTMDFIYLDANHEYEHVRQDLEIWWQSLIPGGIFACHDYLSINLPGVKRAVDEFVAKHQLQLHLTWETGGSAWFIKP